MRRIDWRKVDRVVFVCAGNICRSPLAAAQARALGLPALSAGVRCTGGHPPDARAVRLAKSYGLDLQGDVSTRIQDVDLGEHDLVIGMEPGHLAWPEVTRSGCQAALLGIWLPEPRPYLHDPFTASDAYFERCAALLVAGVKHLVSESGR